MDLWPELVRSDLIVSAEPHTFVCFSLIDWQVFGADWFGQLAVGRLRDACLVKVVWPGPFGMSLRPGPLAILPEPGWFRIACFCLIHLACHV